MQPLQNKPIDIDDDLLAITFDAVGTLIVPHPSVGEIYTEELRSLGYAVSPDALEKNFVDAFGRFKYEYPNAILDRNDWRTIVAYTLHELTPKDDFDHQFETLWNAFTDPKRWRLLPGIESTLSRLRENGLRLFVLSNNDERLHLVLKGLNIDTYFEDVFISTELGVQKPSKQIFDIVQERIAVVPKNILHVGDNLIEDMEGALQAGWNAALVGSATKTIDDKSCRNQPSARLADSVSELFFGPIAASV